MVGKCSIDLSKHINADNSILFVEEFVNTKIKFKVSEKRLIEKGG